MLTRRTFLSYVGVGAITLLAARARRAFARPTNPSRAPRAKAVVYLSPTCGCCHAWVEHLKKNQFDVAVRTLDDVTPVKREHKVPEALWSCHTAVIDGLIVEGHVPADLIARALHERPQGVVGLAVAGMPVGSPGMEQGGRKDPFDVLAISSRGVSRVYAKR